jgi:integrase
MRSGTAREMGLGPYPDITLADARERARTARRLLLDGTDPIEARRAERAISALEGARALSFEQAAEQYIAAHEAAWRNAVHRRQWKSTLTTYAFPVMGALPVSAIDTAVVLKVLEPIWKAKPETASRLRGRIENVLDWATAREYRRGNNPARWRGHLDKLLPSKSKLRSVRHHPAMAYADIPNFSCELRGRDSISARALEFAILTAARTGEVIGAKWAEIDIKGKVWTVPAERMKARREHRVPLSNRALDILTALPRERGGDYLFPGGKIHRPLSNMALAELLKGMDGNGHTVHGFRSSFRDWAAERTSFAREVVEAALAHTIESRVEAAYRRTDLFGKRRGLMEQWAKFCSQAKPAEHAIRMRGRP